MEKVAQLIQAVHVEASAIAWVAIGVLLFEAMNTWASNSARPVFLTFLMPRAGSESLERLVHLYDAWDKPTLAAEWKQKLAEFHQPPNAAEKKGQQP